MNLLGFGQQHLAALYAGRFSWCLFHHCICVFKAMDFFLWHCEVLYSIVDIT